MTAGVEISMDGRGRFMDNIFIERLWRSIKYEEVHLKAYADGCKHWDKISSTNPIERLNGEIKRRADVP